MGMIELAVIASGLSMDAFAAAIGVGLAGGQGKMGHLFRTAFVFGMFQAGMPLAGYLAADHFSNRITALDHWIAFAVLCFIGIKMLRDGRSKKHQPAMQAKNLLLLAVSTSIDAFATGISFAFLEVDIAAAVVMIGCITFLFSAAGVQIGSLFGSRYQTKAEMAGGLLLIVMGIRVVVEHIKM